ncbi:MAG: transposase, partial [Methanobacteriota archaeon]
MGSFVAMDVHERSISFARFLGNHIVEEGKVERTEASLRAFAGRFPDLPVLVEACGRHEFVFDVLGPLGNRVRAFRPPKREAGQRKNDREDARRLGRRHLSGELREVWIPPVEIRRLRDLVGTRVRVAQLKTADQAFVKHTLQRWGHGRRIHDAERTTTDDGEGDAEAAAAARFPFLKPAFERIALSNKHVRALDRVVESEGKTLAPVRRLRSIPGFGPLVSLAYYAALGTPDRFPSADHVVAFLGLDPEHVQSGDSLRDLHRISHKGPSHVRALLDQAAWVHVARAPDSDLTKAF